MPSRYFVYINHSQIVAKLCPELTVTRIISLCVSGKQDVMVKVGDLKVFLASNILINRKRISSLAVANGGGSRQCLMNCCFLTSPTERTDSLFNHSSLHVSISPLIQQTRLDPILCTKYIVKTQFSAFRKFMRSSLYSSGVLVCTRRLLS